MAGIEYALDVAGAPPAKSACPDEDEDGVGDDVCLDVDGDGWCDQDEPGEGDQPPDVPDPTPYEPDCDIMQDECHDGCFPQPTFGEYADCMNACMARAGC